MIKCKLNTERDVALVDETKKSSASTKKFKFEEENLDIITPKVNSQPKERNIQHSDSLNSIKSKEFDNPTHDIQDNTSPTVKKKKKYKKKVAKIEFEELIWNFGDIVEGDIIKKKFNFTNTGKAPLQIIGADASCGCARPTVPFLDIAPGESGKIGITYNSVNKDGDQEPEIIIESNTYPKYTTLKLFGKVKPKSKVAEIIELDSLKINQDTITKK
jgi:hypothetical protein